MNVRPVSRDDRDALERFLLSLPPQDGGFLNADVADVAERSQLLDHSRGRQVIAVDDGVVSASAGTAIAGFASVVPSVGRSKHVAQLRLVVAEGARRQGIGRALARAALLAALDLGLEKLAVEVLAHQQDLVEMFQDLGFEAEALLHDFVLDDDGYADLMVLVHPAPDAARDAALAGLVEESR